MRAISRDAATALLRCRRFRRGNIWVRPYVDGSGSEMRLHGNCIATYDTIANQLCLSDCGWRTNTTKERLNAVLSVFGIHGRIFQRDNRWRICLPFSEQMWTGNFTRIVRIGAAVEHDDPIHER